MNDTHTDKITKRQGLYYLINIQELYYTNTIGLKCTANRIKRNNDKINELKFRNRRVRIF